MHNSQKLVICLDILRVFAIVCVIGGHYFINTDFNQTPFTSSLMFILGMLQTFTMIGVPLFLMLTGYLNLNKTEPSRKYYHGIWRVLIAYLFFSILTILFRKYYLGHEKPIILSLLTGTFLAAQIKDLIFSLFSKKKSATQESPALSVADKSQID